MISVDELLKKLEALNEQYDKVLGSDTPTVYWFGRVKDSVRLIEQNISGNEQLRVALDGVADNYQQNLEFFGMPVKSDNLSEEEYASSLKSILGNFYARVISDFKRLEYLSVINDTNVILVGGNGAGKSSFASYIKQASTSNIVMVAAQKYLFIDVNGNFQYQTMTGDDVRSAQFVDIAALGRKETELYSFRDANEALFTKLLRAMVNDHVIEHTAFHGNTEDFRSNFTRLQEVWKLIFPDIEFVLDALNRTLRVKKKDEEYPVNAMSDGEKVSLFHLLQILFVDDNSFVLVDEPESFLNPTLSNLLWDTLEAVRPDIKFIYISHNMSFVGSRKEASLIWIKSFEYPDEWKLEPMQGIESLPRELVAQLAGTRKPIVFIEGDYSSPDYALFSGMFSEDARVFPVGGHDTVRMYTKSYNNAPEFNGGKAFGIVDRDLMDENEISNSLEDDIYTLPFNEIEMMYFDEDILSMYLTQLSYPTAEVVKKIDDFKNAFFEKVRTSIDEITSMKSKAMLDSFLARERVEKYKDVSAGDMLQEIQQKLSDLNLEEKDKEFKSILEQSVVEKNYTKLLELSPLKKEISLGVANRMLDSKYMEKMANKFKRDPEYAKVLLGKYFSDLQGKLITKFDSK